MSLRMAYAKIDSERLKTISPFCSNPDVALLKRNSDGDSCGVTAVKTVFSTIPLLPELSDTVFCDNVPCQLIHKFEAG